MTYFLEGAGGRGQGAGGRGQGAGGENCTTILVLKKMLNQNTDETNDVWYPSRFMKNGVLYTPFGAYTLLRGYVGSWNSSLWRNKNETECNVHI